ncbi:MAG: SdrD B-like domain-containing protein [Anaerolineae bacterium]
MPLQPTLIIGLGKSGDAVLQHLAASSYVSTLSPQALQRVQVIHFAEEEGDGWRARACSLGQYPDECDQTAVTFDSLGNYLAERLQRSRTYLEETEGPVATELPEQMVHVVGVLGEEICYELLMLCSYWVRRHFADSGVHETVNHFLVVQDSEGAEQQSRAYATLKELDFLRTRRWYRVSLDGKDVQGWPFDRCWIIEKRNRRGFDAKGPLDQVIIVAETLGLLLAPETHRVIRGSHEADLSADKRYEGKPGAYGSLGVSVLELPVDKLQEWAEARLTQTTLDALATRVVPDWVEAEVSSFRQEHRIDGARECSKLLGEIDLSSQINGELKKAEHEFLSSLEVRRIEGQYERLDGLVKGPFSEELNRRMKVTEPKVKKALYAQVDQLVNNPETCVPGALAFVRKLRTGLAALRMNPRDIQFLQKALKRQGISCPDTGKFDRDTQKAVRTFRAQQNLRQTDLVDADVWRLLDPKGWETRSSLGLEDDKAPDTLEKATFEFERTLAAGKAAIAERKQELINSINELKDLNEEFRNRFKHYLILALTGIFTIVVPWLFVTHVLPLVTTESDALSLGWILLSILILFGFLGVLDTLVHIREIKQDLGDWFQRRLLPYLFALLFAVLAFVVFSTMELRLMRKLPGIFRYVSLALIVVVFAYFAIKEFISRSAERLPLPTWYEWGRHWLAPYLIYLLFSILIFSWLPATLLASLILPSIDNTITGIVFVDTDDNGVRGIDESPMAGVDVALLDTQNRVVGVTQTDEGGQFTFSEIMAGAYRVALGAPPHGYRVRAQDEGLSTILHLEGQPLNNDIELALVQESLPSGAISGTVYSDQNGNGIRDEGELGIPGTAVWLRDSHGYLLESTTTAGDGSYMFTELPSGDYTHTVRQYNLDEPYYTILDQVERFSYQVILSVPPDYRLVSPSPLPISLESGQQYDRANFGLTTWPQAFGAVVGRTYRDENRNGIAEVSEPGLPFVLLRLETTEDKSVVATTISDRQGHYEFPTVPAGDYTVFETRPPGWAGYSTVYSASIGEEQALSRDFDHVPANGSRMYRFYLLSVLSRFFFSLSLDSLGAVVGIFFTVLLLVTLLLWGVLHFFARSRVMADRNSYLAAIRAHLDANTRHLTFEHAKKVFDVFKQQLANLDRDLSQIVKAIKGKADKAAEKLKGCRDRLEPSSFLFEYVDTDEQDLHRLYDEYAPSTAEVIADLVTEHGLLRDWQVLFANGSMDSLVTRVQRYAQDIFRPLRDRTLEEELFIKPGSEVARILGRRDAYCAVWWDASEVMLHDVQESACSIAQSHFNEKLLKTPGWSASAYQLQDVDDRHRLILFRSIQGLPLYILGSAEKFKFGYQKWIEDGGEELGPSRWWKFGDESSTPDLWPTVKRKSEIDPDYQKWVVARCLNMLLAQDSIWWLRQEPEGELHAFAENESHYLANDSLCRHLRDSVEQYIQTVGEGVARETIENRLSDKDLSDRAREALEDFLEKRLPRVRF